MSDPLLCTVELPGAPVERFTLQYDGESSVQRGMYEDITSGRMYEPGTWETFKAILREGDTFVDVGAHVGTFSCLAAALVGESGHVQAFEPNDANRRMLRRNLRDGAILSFAVGENPGRVVFHRCADNDGGHALYDPGKQQGNAATRERPSRKMVDMISLDSFEMRPCRLIKVDVEGAEPSVLRGAQRTIATHRPAIIAEQNTIGQAIMGSTESELRDLVTRHGYRCYAIQDSAPYWIPVAPDQTCRPTVVQNGVECLVVFNWLFLPNEWPELAQK